MTRLASDAEPLRYYGPLIGFEMSPGKRGDYVRYSDYAALLTRLDAQESALREATAAVEFVARLAWRTDPPNASGKLTDTERFSAIKFHPTIKVHGAPHRCLAELEASPLAKQVPPPRAEKDGDG